MAAVPTQRQMFYQAHRQLADMLNLFMEMCSHPSHPLTIGEMEAMVAKRPERYGFMLSTIRRMQAEMTPYV